tara:strand:+ start:5540 stop:6544 length:1005 start_codon:yes stop_codon:yes gene_type:complete
MIFDILVGLQHGDEGKGKVVHHLFKSNKYTHCVRFNGGPNAGHTIYHKGNKLVLHQIPVGIIWGVDCVIGPGCVVNLKKLDEEILYLQENGISNINKNLFIAHNAHVILDEYIDEDNKTDTIGSTGEGIKPAYANKYKKIGTRIEDIHELKDKFNVINTSTFLNKPDNYILFEGAQGYMLDIDWGDYPYVTSSHCLSYGALSCGVPMQHIDKIYGICKIYDTYVGNKKFQDPNDTFLQELAKEGNEFGATTGRPRQCGWLDLPKLKQAIVSNGITNLIINKCDIIKIVNTFRLYDGKGLRSFVNYEDMCTFIRDSLRECDFLKEVVFSASPNKI